MFYIKPSFIQGKIIKYIIFISKVLVVELPPKKHLSSIEVFTKSKNWCFWTVVLEKTLESPLDCKEIQPVHSKGDQSWVFFGRTDAKAETVILWPPHAKSWLVGNDWCWEGLGAGGEGDDRGWDGWMALLTQWMWVWVNSRSWWWTGRPGVLRFMGSQRVGHDWVTELNWTESALVSVPNQMLISSRNTIKNTTKKCLNMWAPYA